MRKHSVRNKSSLAGGLAVWMVLLLAVPNNTYAGRVGEEWYLISREGKLIRKLDWKQRDVVDAEAGLIDRLENHVLTANGFEDAAVRWSVQCPVQTPYGEAALFHSDSDVLSILGHGILHGYDKRTGRELYRTPVDRRARDF